jgi:hypothetical protein
MQGDFGKRVKSAYVGAKLVISTTRKLYKCIPIADSKSKR